MTHWFTKAATVLAAAAIVPVASAVTAHADPGTVHFRSGNFNCAITGDGAVGCDLTEPTKLDYNFLPFLLTVNDVVIDQSWLPAHPTFDSSTPHTLPGGNPQLSEVKTGDGMWGPQIEHAGATCEVGFHGTFSCDAKGHSFSVFNGVVSA